MLLCFLVYLFRYYSKLKVIGLWTKQDILGHHLGLWETVINIFTIFFHFIELKSKRLIWKMNNRLVAFEQTTLSLKALIWYSPTVYQCSSQYVTDQSITPNRRCQYHINIHFIWSVITINSNLWIISLSFQEAACIRKWHGFIRVFIACSQIYVMF